MTMQLFVGPLCNFSAKVRMAFAEKGVPFECVEVPFSLANGQSPKHPVVLAVNPKAETPVLVDGPLQLYDSTVILEYLEDRFPTPALYPSEPAARAHCRILEAQADELLWPNLSAWMSATKRSDRSGAAEIRSELERLQRELDGKLQGRDFLCDAYSVADIAPFAHLDFGRAMGCQIDIRCHALTSWFDRVSLRGAVSMVRHAQESALQRLLQS